MKDLKRHLNKETAKKLLGVFLLLYLCGYRPSLNLLTGNLNTWTSSKYCFSIAYPSSWRVVDSGTSGYHQHHFERVRFINGLVLVSNGRVTIDQKQFQQPSFEEGIIWSNEMIQNNYSQVRIIDENLHGAEAFRIYDTNGTLHQEAYIVRETDIIIIRLSVLAKNFDELLLDFEEVIDSFEDSSMTDKCS